MGGFIKMENYQETPQEVRGWNWGAFCFSVVWGLGNKVYWPLLCLVPFFNIIWVFVCGINGNRWLWQTNQYQDVATFKAVQETWNRAGFIMFILSAVMLVLSVIFVLIISIFASSVYY